MGENALLLSVLSIPHLVKYMQETKTYEACFRAWETNMGRQIQKLYYIKKNIS